MVDKVNPSVNRPAGAFKTAGAITYGGHGGGTYQGFVVDGASPTELSVQDGDITESNFNTFTQTSSSSSLNIDIDPGEGFVYGSWCAIDTNTTVSLAASTTGQTVYVGWNKDGSDDVLVGLQSTFDNATGNTDQKIPLFDFDTDGSGVTSVTDRRQIGYSIDIEGVLKFNDGAVEVQYDGTNLQFSGAVIEMVDGADVQTGLVLPVGTDQYLA